MTTLTNYEASLALVATAMKKARLTVDNLVINSFFAGILFSIGGIFFVSIEAYNPWMVQNCPGFAMILKGTCYAPSLFYVVILGADLFNSNILFFTVALLRRSVSILDVAISWIVSYWFNLVGCIFVSYVICHFSNLSRDPAYVEASIKELMHLASLSFVERMIRGMAGNFFVDLAIFLQIKVDPLHVKLIVILLPIGTIASLGFTHCVADFYILISGLINKAPISVGKVAWKIMIPSFIGNIIGGCLTALVIFWYLHIFSVERDRNALRLPFKKVRDQQPEINSDSKVVAENEKEGEKESEKESENEGENEGENECSSCDDDELVQEDSMYPQALRESDVSQNRPRRWSTAASKFSTASKSSLRLSPARVFPIQGMEAPTAQERSIAEGSGFESIYENGELSSVNEEKGNGFSSAVFLGDHVKRLFGRKKTQNKDYER